jgi:ELWxxDGT repeat protein
LVAAVPGASAALNQPERVTDIQAGPLSSAINAPATLGRHLYFGATNGLDDELWRTDGSAAGTEQVANINPTGGSSPGTVTAFGGAVIFHAFEPATGEEPWRSDGTSAGTTQLGDLNPNAGSSSARGFIQVGDQLLFRADNGTDGAELWRTDGTPAGTAMVEDINPAGGSIGGAFFPAVLNGFAYFSATEPVAGSELYRSDGTAAGTGLVQNIALAGGSSPQLITPVGNWLYFTADDGTVGRELWRSDGVPGAAGTTELVDDINGVAAGSSVTGLTEFQDRVYFAADGPGNGIELWRSDGTTTEIVADVNPVGDSEPRSLTVVGDQLFFTANDGTHGREVWVSDGVPEPAGTTGLVADLDPGGSSPCITPQLTALGEHLYLCADDGTSGSELWRSDGTEAGTQRFDINALGSSNPGSFTVHDGTLYFTATDAVAGAELWAFDTATPGTEIAGGPAAEEHVREQRPEFRLLSSAIDLARFECRVDDGAFGACAGLDGAAKTDRLGDGRHVFEARAVDVHENPDPTPDTRAFRVDTKAKVTIVGRKLRLTGGKLRAKLRCPRSEKSGPCRGKLKVESRAAGKRKLVLAKGRFKVKSGKARRAKLKLRVSGGTLASQVEASDGRVRARAKVRDRLGNKGRVKKTLGIDGGG